MTVRMQPNAIHEELIRSWDAVPVAVELSEAIRLITSLAVDAQENPLANTVAYGVDRVHPHVTMTGHLYGARGLFAHRETVESMSDDLRDIVRSAVAAAITTQRTAAADHEAELREQLEGAGIEFVDLSDEERTAFVAASQPAIDMAHLTVDDALLKLAAA